jgi:DNA-binding FadR family transcriptional regulator
VRQPHEVGVAAAPPAKAAAVIGLDLCRQIVEGDLREGDLLPAEAELMERYGVSRAVLREAMRLLEWDSFVTIRRGAGGGARVTLPDARVAARYCGLLLQAQGTTLADVDAALRAIEPEIVRRIAAGREPPTETLEVALRAEAGAIGDPSAFVFAGSRFHEVLPTALANPALTSLLGIVREVRERHNLAALTGSVDEGSDHRRSHAAHQRVLDLMRQGSAADAHALWVRHMNATSRALARTSAKTVLDLFSDGSARLDWAAAPREGRRMTRLPKGADIVAGELRRRIIGGVMREGDFIPTESALMQQFGLSRPSVREALRVLEAEHLVQPVRGSHHGGRVRPPTVTRAVWHTGLLLERTGSTVGQLLDAQRLLEHCLGEQLGGADPGAVVRSLEPPLPSRPGSGPTAQIGVVLDRYAALSDCVPNLTLRCLATIGRELVRSGVAAGDPAWRSRPFDRRYAESRALARDGDLPGVIAVWRADSDELYLRLRGVVDADRTVDMFGSPSAPPDRSRPDRPPPAVRRRVQQ